MFDHRVTHGIIEQLQLQGLRFSWCLVMRVPRDSISPLRSMVEPFRVAYDLPLQCRTESKAIIENHQMWWALRKANL